MNTYSVALFVHLLGVVTLFIAIGLVQRVGAQVRAAATLDHLRLWLGLLRTTRNMFPAAIVMLLAGGLFMTAKAWTFTTPWAVVGLSGLAAMAVLGALVVGRGLEAIATAALAAGEDAIPPHVARLIHRPGTWLVSFALNGMAIGVLFIMATKPGWLVSTAAVLGAGAIGATLGMAIITPSRSRTPSRTT